MTHDTDEESIPKTVLAVILMVAFTVILAAVIGALVVGLWGDNDPAEYSHTCTGHCEAVQSIEVDGDSIGRGQTTVTAVLERPVGGSIVVRGDGGSPVQEATLRSERVVTVELDGDHHDPQVDVWVEGGSDE